MKSPSLYGSACAATIVAAALLSACGGGNDNGTTSVASTTPSAPATAASFTLAGTAATGAAIAGGAVTANCTVGSASGTTAADGTFTLVFDKGQVAPCLLRVTKAGPPALELYGFAAAAGHVNITTLTDSALTKALAASPAEVFAGFDLARANAINAALPAAITYLQTQLAAASLGSVPADLLTNSFVVGDNFDKLLDGIGAAFLGAGHTYADFIAKVKLGADLINIITPAGLAANDITVSPIILATPLTGQLQYLKTAADLAGFSGSHVFGRGVRSELQTLANPFPPFSPVTGCKLSIEGGDFVFSAGGQTTRVSMTPYVAVVGGVEYPGSYVGASPRSIYGNALQMVLVSAPNSAGKANALFLSIQNGVVTDVAANDGAAGTGTSCGVSTGGNLNTDRGLDVLALPTALVAELKTSAAAMAGLVKVSNKTVSPAEVAGFAASLNLGLGTYATINPDFTVKDVTRVSDCKVEIVSGVVRLSSVQAGFDHSFTVNRATFASQGNDKLIFVGREGSDLTAPQVTVTIDERTTVPVVTSVESSNFGSSKQAVLSCPRG